jgi:opine dehydrogenase
MRNVVIVGGGHVGLTLLGELIESRDSHGCEVSMLRCRNVGEKRDELLPTGSTIVMKHIPDDVEFVTDTSGVRVAWAFSESGRQLLAGADVIFITVPDIPELRIRIYETLFFAERTRRQVIVLVRAGQGGQLIAADMLRRARDSALDVVLVEDSFYGTRAAGPVVEYKRKLSVNVSCYGLMPGEAISKVRSLFPLGHMISRSSWPELIPEPGIRLLFDPLGYIIHSGVALYRPNLAHTRMGVQYNHYVDGIDPVLARRLDALDHERVELARAYGVSLETFPSILHRQYGLPLIDDFYLMIQSCRSIYRSMSLPSVRALSKSRYVLEDLPALRTVGWLAERAGVSLPATADFMAESMTAASSLGVEMSALAGYEPYLNSIDGGISEIIDLASDPVKRAGLSAETAKIP